MNNYEHLFGVEAIKNQENQLHVRYLGSVSNWNSWAGCDSASRAQMFTSHMAQIPVISNPTPRRTMTGVERGYGKYTFRQTMPEDGTFVEIIDKYSNHLGHIKTKDNPSRLGIFSCDSSDFGTFHYGVVEVTPFNCRHQYFGYQCRINPTNYNKIAPGRSVPGGAVFATSPCVDDDDFYTPGVSSKIIYMSLHTTIEDGICANREWLKKFTSVGVESRAGTWGGQYYPINLYGDDEVYRGHPEIGGRIADHGIIYALREYDPLLAVVDMTVDALQEIDYIYDKRTYGEPNAEVIDITVFHDHNLDNKPDERTPKGIDEQSLRYYSALYSQQQKLIKFYENLVREHKHHPDRLVLSPDLHRRIVWAYGFTGYNDPSVKPKPRINLTYRRAPVGDFRTEIVFKYEIVPAEGSKFTNCHGGR